MTAISSESPSIGWGSATEKKFSVTFETDPEKITAFLTNKMANEIFKEEWCKNHNIFNTKHRNNVICKVIREICRNEVSKEVVKLFFVTLSQPQFKLFPLDHPLYLHTCFKGYGAYSENDFHVQLGRELSGAIENKNEQLACEILEFSGDVDQDFFIIAVKNDCCGVVEKLLKKQEYSNEFIDSCLVDACKYDALEATKILLKEGANPNRLLPIKGSAVHAASASKNPEILKAIFEHSGTGVSLDELNKWSKTTALIAYQEGCEENFDLLVSKMQDPNMLDAHGFALIHYMCSEECNKVFNPTAIEILVKKHGASVTTLNYEGKSPIEMATANTRYNLSSSKNYWMDLVGILQLLTKDENSDT